MTREDPMTPQTVTPPRTISWTNSWRVLWTLEVLVWGRYIEYSVHYGKNVIFWTFLDVVHPPSGDWKLFLYPFRAPDIVISWLCRSAHESTLPMSYVDTLGLGHNYPILLNFQSHRWVSIHRPILLNSDSRIVCDMVNNFQPFLWPWC